MVVKYRVEKWSAKKEVKTNTQTHKSVVTAGMIKLSPLERGEGVDNQEDLFSRPVSKTHTI